MKRATRYLTGLLTASTLMVGLGAGTAQAEQPPAPTPPKERIAAPAVPPAKTVSAGMRLAFDDWENWGSACTLGAVGTDSAGRKVGITAGHCNPKVAPAPTYDKTPSGNVNDPYPGFNPYPGVENLNQEDLDNKHPVWDWRDVAAGPIGWIRFVSNDTRNGEAAVRNTLDYMVIEFASNITLSSQVMTAPKYGPYPDGTPFSVQFARDPSPTILVPSQPWYKMNKIYSDAAGNPSVMPVNWFGGWLCNAGSFTAQQSAQNNDPTSVSCGIIWENHNNFNYTGAAQIQGDSGGPANPKGQSNTWAGIASWYVGGGLEGGPGVYYSVYTSPKAILDNLNPRGITGSGFQITNN